MPAKNELTSNPENELGNPPRFIIIDSQPSVSNGMCERFENIGVFGLARRPYQNMFQLREEILSQDLSGIQFIIADQFLDQELLRDMTGEIIERVRAENPSVWVIEQSGHLQGSKYQGDVHFHKFDAIRMVSSFTSEQEGLRVKLQQNDDPLVLSEKWIEFTKPREESQEPQPNHVLIIEDRPGLRTSYKMYFNDLGFQSVTPDIESSEAMSSWLSAQNEHSFSQVAVVIVDQRLKWDQKKFARKLLTSVNGNNPEAWIIETSGAPKERVYRETSSTVERLTLSKAMRKLGKLKLRLDSLPEHSTKDVTLSLISRLKEETNEGFISARSLDESSVSYLESNFTKIQKNEFWEELLEVNGFDIESIIERFKEYSREQKILMLHDLWNIIGHLMLNRDDIFYSEAVFRLSKSLSNE